jgi:hypothetical protein
MMVRRLDQLSERLPFQSQVISMPFENTHGGFELLSSGVTNLGPELSGWYGAPGINPEGQTTLFLVGDNFSVNQTRVIIGGRMVDSSCIVKCPDEGTATTCECPVGTSQSAATKTKPKDKNALADEEPGLESGAAPTGDPSVASASDEGVTQASFRNPRFCRRQQQGTTSTSTTVRVPPVLPPLQAIIQVPGMSSQPQPISVNVPVTLPKDGGLTTTPVAFADPPAPAPAPTPDPTANKKQDTPPNKLPYTTPSTCADLTCYYQLPIFQVELLSRQVMRVVIPKGVYSDSKGFVDVHVATPYGVSQRIAIPVLCPSLAPVPKCADKTKITIPYCVKKDKTVDLPSNMKPSGTFCITLPKTLPKEMGPEGSFKVVFEFGTTKIEVKDVAFHGGEGDLSEAQVKQFAQDLLKQLKVMDSANLPSMSPSKITVMTQDAKPTSQALDQLPAFQVEFQNCGSCKQ